MVTARKHDLRPPFQQRPQITQFQQIARRVVNPEHPPPRPGQQGNEVMPAIGNIEVGIIGEFTGVEGGSQRRPVHAAIA